jgi:prepilin-type N-terminal cleavage/methylation domain-containing protein
VSASKNINRGFTIVELLIVITVTAVLSLALTAAITNYLVLISRNNASIDMSSSSQNLLRNTVEALRTGDGVRQTNAISDSHAPPGGWNTNNTNFVIVIAVPAEDSSHNYIVDTSTGSPYMNELVYYKNNSSLMRRILSNPSAVGDSLITSCPPSLASAGCPADVDLADYVSSMTFTLYDQDSALTTDPTLARSIKIDLTMSRYAYGSPVTLTDNIRVTLRNRF